MNLVHRAPSSGLVGYWQVTGSWGCGLMQNVKPFTPPSLLAPLLNQDSWWQAWLIAAASPELLTTARPPPLDLLASSGKIPLGTFDSLGI